MREEIITLEQLFTEEKAALEEYIVIKKQEKIDTYWSDRKFFELQEEIVKLEIVVEYLENRLQGNV